MSVTFAGVAPRPGSVVRARVPMGALADGSPITLPVVAITGEASGPTVYLQAGVHGDEVTGVRVLLGALERIDPADVRGTIIAVPSANPAALITKSRGFALEERGPLDINRIFPGKPNGLLSERIAHLLFSEFVLKADLTIDLHSALTGCDIYPFVYISPDDDETGTLMIRTRIARAFGTPLCYRVKRGSKLGTSVMTGALSTQADEQRKPVVTVEMGRSHQVSWEFVELGVEGCLNALRAFGSLTGAVRATPEPTTFSSITLVHASASGLFEPRTEFGARVPAGALLGEVIDIGTQRRHAVSSPIDGTVLRVMTDAIVMIGAELFWVVK
jgi:predicted deacylase